MLSQSSDKDLENKENILNNYTNPIKFVYNPKDKRKRYYNSSYLLLNVNF